MTEYQSILNQSILDAGDAIIGGLTPGSILYLDSNSLLANTTIGSGLTWSAPTLSVNNSTLDHGLLAGLADDDHTQYHNDARALAWILSRSTSDLPEGSNLYYTNTRARSALSGGTGINYNSTTGEIKTNDSQIDHGTLSGLADDDHTQYHNSTRALTWLGTRSTSDLPQGTNLYYTDALARASNSAGTGISYNSTTGVITNSGVTSVTGTANQVNTTGSTGAITLSLPQSIAAASSPTFAGLTVGALAGILKATAGVISGSATTSDLTEGSNLYYTDARARASNSAGTGISYNSSTGVITNSGVTSITGTSNQVNASASTGGITLSTPQDIGTASSVQFGSVKTGTLAVSAGSVPSNTMAVIRPDLASLGTTTQGLLIGDSGTFTARANNTLFAMLRTNNQLMDLGAYTGMNYVGNYLQNNLVTKSGTGSISYAYGIYSAGFSSLATNQYGAVFGAPTGGTINTALYSDNLVVGNSGVNPPTQGIYSEGNIKQGSSTPITLSNVDQGTGAWLRNDGNLVISTNTGDMYYGYSGNSKSHYFYSNLTQLGRWNTIGLSIGSNPAYEKLEVEGNIISNWATSGRFIGSQFSDGSGYRLGMILDGNDRNTKIVAKSGDAYSVSGITFHTGTGPTERMRITKTGTVGIGTTTVDATKFQVGSTFDSWYDAYGVYGNIMLSNEVVYLSKSTSGALNKDCHLYIGCNYTTPGYGASIILGARGNNFGSAQMPHSRITGGIDLVGGYNGFFTVEVIHGDDGKLYEALRCDYLRNLCVRAGDAANGGGNICIRNSLGVPSTNPSNGGILYCEGGALKYRGSSGTVTTIANA